MKSFERNKQQAELPSAPSGKERAPLTLSVRNLHKKIGRRTIIHDVSFEVKRGEVFGFLGPNGAGKTTTIRMLVGLIRPTGGSVEIGGCDLRKDFIGAMRRVGCIVENPELYRFLTGRENLEQFARMLGEVDNERIADVARLVEMDKRLDDRVSTYSLGMRQRLGIAQALLGRPELLILDEPTNGLDPAGIRELRTFVRKLAEEEGISVFVSSHLLGEVQMMCDRVAIISQGKVIRTLSVKELADAETGQVEWLLDPVAEGAEALGELSFVEELHVQEDEQRISCSMPFARVAEANAHLVQRGIRVLEVKRKTGTLEDLFMALTGGDRIE